MTLPADFYESDAYWQEFDCPRCFLDFDVSPPKSRGTPIQCVGCDHEWLSPAHGQAYFEVPKTEENEVGLAHVNDEDMP